MSNERVRGWPPRLDVAVPVEAVGVAALARAVAALRRAVAALGARPELVRPPRPVVAAAAGLALTCALRLVTAGGVCLARALGWTFALPVPLALALAVVLALAFARGAAPGSALALTLGFRPGRAGGVGMAVTVLVFNQDFSNVVSPAAVRGRLTAA
jgi:hypothetical protein